MCNDLKVKVFLCINSCLSLFLVQKYCMASKAHLASIHSPAEYAFIQQLVRSQTHAYTRAWIGGSDGAEVQKLAIRDWSR